MSVKTYRIIIALISCILLSIFALDLFKTSLFKKPLNRAQFHGTLLDKPRTIAPFSLTGIDQKPFTLTSLQGQWTMMFFGFTRCGSICPTTMATFGKMYRLLEQQHVTPLPKIVMISLDPKHDDLATLRHYVEAFHPSFYGATGDEASIHQLTKTLGIAYTTVLRHATTQSTYDEIEHSGAIMLFNPKGQLIAFFTPPHTANSLAHDYHLLID